MNRAQDGPLLTQRRVSTTFGRGTTTRRRGGSWGGTHLVVGTRMWATIQRTS